MSGPGIRIQLLGECRVEVDGILRPPPRGRKVWAVLAYLLGARVAVSREMLAELLFGEADDPLGAVRWSLSQLRRLLGSAEISGGFLRSCAVAADGACRRARILEALCDLAIHGHLPAAAGWVEDLWSLAARTGMREFAARALLYRARLGDGDAWSTARVQ